MKMNSKKGFTLAEVLITLTIIGVIAALTIPSLVNNIGDQQTKVAWKKIYGDLNQTWLRYTVNYSNPNTGFTSDAQFATAFGNYMNFVRLCQTKAVSTAAPGNCYPNINPTTYDGKGQAGAPYDGAGIVLGNGAMLDFKAAIPPATVDGLANSVGTIYVDTNGVNPPNRVGKDVYAVHVTAYSIVAYGGQGDGADCSTTGWGCSAFNLYN